MRAFVQTVTGPVPPDSLGLTLTHAYGLPAPAILGSLPRARFANWVGNETFAPAVTARPRSEAEVQAAVRDATSVRCLGAGHSFSPVHRTDGTLLHTDALRACGASTPEAVA